MRNLIVLFSVLYLATFSVFGQDNVLRFEIQQARNANIHFDSVVISQASVDTVVFKHFVDTNEVFFLGNISLDVKNNTVSAMNLTIPTKNNQNMILELVEVPEYFYDYKVVTSDGDTFPANRDIKHYRGVVRGETNSLVAITFYEDEIMGLVCTDEGNFNIVKDRLSGKHLFYNDKNLKEKPDMICTTEDDPSIEYDSVILFSPRNNLKEEIAVTRSSILEKIVSFYVETEYDIYQARGSYSSVEAYISGLFNQVATLYRNENIYTRVSTMYLWLSSSPYTGGSTGADTEVLLKQFQTERTSINGDLGMLLKFNDLSGGRAVVDGLCNSSTKNKLGVSTLWEGSYATVPNYSRQVLVVTHEFGHLFGSKHTHDCVWNGNKTAIDGCGPNAGHPGDGNCTNPGNPPGGGTIMSYCDLSGFGLPGINFNLGFGTQPGNVIRNKVNNASCLCTVMFTDKTVTTNTTVTSQCNIYVKNVTVTNNKKLTLDAANETIIEGNFEVQAGSELEIK